MFSCHRGSRLAALLCAAAFQPVSLVLAQSPDWLTQLGSPNDDQARAVAPDGAGGAYVSAFINGEALLRVDGSGAVLWARPLNGRAYGAAPDGAGGVIVGGDIVASSGTDLDFYLARFDAAGNQVWERSFGTSQDERCWSVTTDGSGGVFAAGETKGSFAGSSLGQQDVVVLRVDGGGSQLWGNQFGTAGADVGLDVATDGAGGVYVSGDLNGGILDADSFYAHHDAVGTQSWLRSYAKDRRTGTFSRIASDGAGGVIVAGTIRRAALEFDAWVARYDDRGRQVWNRGFRSGGFDAVDGLAPDGKGGVFVSGTTAERYGATSDGFLARYDSRGRNTWLHVMPDAWFIARRVPGLAPDGAGGFFVAGTTGMLLGDQMFGMSDVWAAHFPGW